MIVLQTIAVAFAMFSAIPVPQFEWNEKNMRYAMCAFPLIGVVIGAAWCVCGALPLPGFAKAAGFALIPVWITGCIHLDGYADTCDALSSYGDREKKLEILKDPHCGAFAVIRLCSYFLAYFALCTCVSFTPSVGVLWVLALVLERALSGLAVASFPMAKNTGLAHTFATAADKTVVRRVLAALGGFDIAGLCGVFLGGALERLPIVMDGFISGVAALCAVRLCPAAEKAVFASHVSGEPAAHIVLDALCKKPLITAELHLGEGTGAVASIPLWDMALAVYGGCYSFAEGGIAPYTPQC